MYFLLVAHTTFLEISCRGTIDNGTPRCPLHHFTDNNLAVTCDFQQSGIATSVDSNEPVQPLFKLRNSKCCSVSCLIFIDYSFN